MKKNITKSIEKSIKSVKSGLIRLIEYTKPLQNSLNLLAAYTAGTTTYQHILQAYPNFDFTEKILTTTVAALSGLLVAYPITNFLADCQATVNIEKFIDDYFKETLKTISKKEHNNLEQEVEENDFPCLISILSEQADDAERELQAYKISNEQHLNEVSKLQKTLSNVLTAHKKSKITDSRYSRKEIAMAYLPLANILDRAIQASPKDVGLQAMYAIHLEFMKSIELKGIESIGVKFNPEKHYAKAENYNEEVPKGEIVAEIKKGYKLFNYGKEIIQTPEVIVASGKESK